MAYKVYVLETKVKRFLVNAESEEEAVKIVDKDKYTLSFGLSEWHDAIICAKEVK